MPSQCQGIAKCKAGDLSGALEAYERAVHVHGRLGTLSTERGAALLRSLGLVKGELFDHDGAVKAFLEAKRIRESIGALETLEGAGVCRGGRSRWAEVRTTWRARQASRC